MAELLYFSPRSQLTARANMAEFINLCRSKLTIFGNSLEFESDVWDITEYIGYKGTRTATRLKFLRWGVKKSTTSGPLLEPFKSLAKSYIRYQQGLRPTKSPEGRLIALRALFEALYECGQNIEPTSILPFHFNRAAQLVKERVSAASAYQYGVQLELISSTMSECGLLSQPFTWRSPIQRIDVFSKVGEEFDKRRISRLPSPASLAAIAAIFRVAEDPRDVFVTSAAAIMCSAPERVNEVLRLSIFSEVNEVTYGLRWFPSKGAAPQVKWIIQSMEEVVKTAIARLKKISEPARKIAKWYEENPTQIYLPKHLEHLRAEEFIDMNQLAALLFDEPTQRTVANCWCKTYRVPVIIFDRRSYVLFSDVETAVLGMLPRSFPHVHKDYDLRYSDALFILRRNEMHKCRATYQCMFSPIDQRDIYKRICVTAGDRDSIFEKFGFREPDGSKISLRTHQIRHYLNTIAQLGGMSQLDIALWSGRARVAENKAYDHVSNHDVLHMMRSATSQPQPTHALAKIDRRSLIRREEFAKLKVPTAHSTDFGWCGHDFTMLPCLAHQDCLNCNEHVCLKGDSEKESRVRRLIDETRVLLAKAEIAAAEQRAGAARWIEHQRKTLDRAEEILRILEDPSIPQGSVIRVSNPRMPSQLAMAVQERQRLIESTNAASSGQLRGRGTSDA